MSKWLSFRETRAKDRWREHYKRELAKLHKLSADLGNFGPKCPASQIFRLAEQVEQNLKVSDLPLPLVMATSEGGFRSSGGNPIENFRSSSTLTIVWSTFSVLAGRDGVTLPTLLKLTTWLSDS